MDLGLGRNSGPSWSTASSVTPAAQARAFITKCAPTSAISSIGSGKKTANCRGKFGSFAQQNLDSKQHCARHFLTQWDKYSGILQSSRDGANRAQSPRPLHSFLNRAGWLLPPLDAAQGCCSGWRSCNEMFMVLVIRHRGF